MTYQSNIIANDLEPFADNVTDLGTASKFWRFIFTRILNVPGGLSNGFVHGPPSFINSFYLSYNAYYNGVSWVVANPGIGTSCISIENSAIIFYMNTPGNAPTNPLMSITANGIYIWADLVPFVLFLNIGSPVFPFNNTYSRHLFMKPITNGEVLNIKNAADTTCLSVVTDTTADLSTLTMAGTTTTNALSVVTDATVSGNLIFNTNNQRIEIPSGTCTGYIYGEDNSLNSAYNTYFDGSVNFAFNAYYDGRVWVVPNTATYTSRMQAFNGVISFFVGNIGVPPTEQVMTLNLSDITISKLLAPADDNINIGVSTNSFRNMYIQRIFIRSLNTNNEVLNIKNSGDITCLSMVTGAPPDMSTLTMAGTITTNALSVLTDAYIAGNLILNSSDQQLQMAAGSVTGYVTGAPSSMNLTYNTYYDGSSWVIPNASQGMSRILTSNGIISFNVADTGDLPFDAMRIAPNAISIYTNLLPEGGVDIGLTSSPFTNAYLKGLFIKPSADVEVLNIKNSTGTTCLSVVTNAIATSSTLTLAGNLIFNSANQRIEMATGAATGYVSGAANGMNLSYNTYYDGSSWVIPNAGQGMSRIETTSGRIVFLLADAGNFPFYPMIIDPSYIYFYRNLIPINTVDIGSIVSPFQNAYLKGLFIKPSADAEVLNIKNSAGTTCLSVVTSNITSNIAVSSTLTMAGNLIFNSSNRRIEMPAGSSTAYVSSILGSINLSYNNYYDGFFWVIPNASQGMSRITTSTGIITFNVADAGNSSFDAMHIAPNAISIYTNLLAAGNVDIGLTSSPFTNAYLKGLFIKPSTDAEVLNIKNSVGTTCLSVVTNATAASSTLTLAGNLIFNSAYRRIEMSAGVSTAYVTSIPGSMNLSYNTYYDGSIWVIPNASQGMSRIETSTGVITFNVATAGNSSFVAMNITPSNILICTKLLPAGAIDIGSDSSPFVNAYLRGLFIRPPGAVDGEVLNIKNSFGTTCLSVVTSSIAASSTLTFSGVMTTNSLTVNAGAAITGNVILAGNLTPSGTLRTLGDSSNRFQTLYSENINTEVLYAKNSANILCAAAFIPTTNNSQSLGFDGVRWANLFSYLGTISDLTTDRIRAANLDYIYFHGDPIPDAPNTRSIGKSYHAWGAVWSVTGSITLSSKSIKENITDLEQDNACNFILSLEPKKYEFIDPALKVPSKKQYGFVIEQVCEAMSSTNYEDFGGIIYEDKVAKGMAYHALLAPMVATMQCMHKDSNVLKDTVLEQQKTIDCMHKDYSILKDIVLEQQKTIDVLTELVQKNLDFLQKSSNIKNLKISDDAKQ